MFDGIAWTDAYYIYHSVFILAFDFLARPWDEADTPEDTARKQSVRNVMTSLQNIKLCTTFAVLTQVALQLAKIVGIFDVQGQAEKSEEYRLYMEQQQAMFTFDYGHPTSSAPTNVGNVVNTWFQKEPVELPWDLKEFFGVEGFVGASAPQGMGGMPGISGHPMMGMGTLGGFPNHLPGVGDEDDLSAPVPPHTAYNTPWGAIDTPFAQGRSGSIHKGPPPGMGL